MSQFLLAGNDSNCCTKIFVKVSRTITYAPPLIWGLTWRRLRGAVSFMSLLFCVGLPAFSQDVNITRMELLTDGAVAVYYDLTDENTEKKYALHLYSSIDNYIQPLEKVEGDIGVDLFVGKNKRLVWRAKEELGEDFTGDVALE
ncbi:MAG: hypothetical protein OEY51_10910, partial [Cyclobacteriaceae bacterium]|nr:hypothetical protein [Cyclobacteriaceae bacterium]